MHGVLLWQTRLLSRSAPCANGVNETQADPLPMNKNEGARLVVPDVKLARSKVCSTPSAGSVSALADPVSSTKKIARSVLCSVGQTT